MEKITCIQKKAKDGTSEEILYKNLLKGYNKIMELISKLYILKYESARDVKLVFFFFLVFHQIDYY